MLGHKTGLSKFQFSCSVVSDSVTPWTAACQASLSITSSQSLLKLMSITSVMSPNHLILCCPLLLPSIFPTIRIFSNESVLHIRWPKYWSFSFNISPSNEHSGLISFRMDWLDLLADQETLKSLLQQHSSKASVLLCLAFFIVQLSHPYMTTGKTTALTRQTFVGKDNRLLQVTICQVNKMDKLEEMDRFLEMCTLPRLNQEERENIDKQVTSTRIETVIKNLPTNKNPGPDGFAGKFYQILR